jgi:hypothetical protein
MVTSYADRYETPLEQTCAADCEPRLVRGSERAWKSCMNVRPLRSYCSGPWRKLPSARFPCRAWIRALDFARNYAPAVEGGTLLFYIPRPLPRAVGQCITGSFARGAPFGKGPQSLSGHEQRACRPGSASSSTICSPPVASGFFNGSTVPFMRMRSIKRTL